ncbi:hypothetical protein C8R43DRAFT_944805 [Mycena crocata]|nr:hypothetical protein C8R43DRAFT_944805 [Mycena crocata]
MSASNHPSGPVFPSRSRRVVIACTNCRKRKIRRCANKGLQCEYIPVPNQPDSSHSHSGPKSSAPIQLSHPIPPGSSQAPPTPQAGYSQHRATAAHRHPFSGEGPHSQDSNPAANPSYPQQFIPNSNNPYLPPGRAAPYPSTNQPVYPDAMGAYNAANNLVAQMVNPTPYGWSQLERAERDGLGRIMMCRNAGRWIGSSISGFWPTRVHVRDLRKATLNSDKMTDIVFGIFMQSLLATRRSTKSQNLIEIPVYGRGFGSILMAVRDTSDGYLAEFEYIGLSAHHISDPVKPVSIPESYKWLSAVASSQIHTTYLTAFDEESP